MQGVINNGLIAGPRQLYENNLTASGEKVGRGIYCTPFIEETDDYTKNCLNKIKIDGKENITEMHENLMKITYYL